MSFQLLKALKNGPFEFECLQVFHDFQHLQISVFTVGIPIETNHTSCPRIWQLLIYYRDSHSNKLINDLTRLQTQTDRSSRLFGVRSSASDMFLSWTCLIDYNTKMDSLFFLNSEVGTATECIKNHFFVSIMEFCGMLR